MPISAPQPTEVSSPASITLMLDRIRHALERYIARREGTATASEPLPEAPAQLPMALERLRAAFRLSTFECELLLFCAAIELDASFLPLFARANGDPLRAYPTFSLALAALPQAHWSAVAPSGPLRRWRLIDVGNGSALTLSPLRIDERVLHFLAGVAYIDERLGGIVTFIDSQMANLLVPSQRALLERISKICTYEAGTLHLPLIQLCGNDRAARQSVAAALSRMAGLKLFALPAEMIPTAPPELDTLLRLWERESALSWSLLLIESDDLEASDNARAVAIARMVGRVVGPLIISGRERLRSLQRPVYTFDVPHPETAEQRQVWQMTLGEAGQRLNGQIDMLVAQFDMGAHAIHTAGTEALSKLVHMPEADVGALLWDTCRGQARPRLEDLAQRIEATSTWDDLVLPAAQMQILRDIAAHVRQRSKVYDAWGFAQKGMRGLGISAMFAGASGTGKTMAAEVLAHALHLDLYRIDLSSVVSKYIGETEKNLRRIFDAAESGGSILLFDEADALFGKRSEVKDSHDRYANIEVSYLLQRMEAYRGLAILTTNLKSALDTAFLRRLRFVIQFPFPDASQRAEIWRRVFPPSTPTEGLDIDRLARLNVAGGNIRNIALNAAFLAADAGEPVRMIHMLRAARAEYAKLEKTLTDAEVAGWV